MRILDLIRLCEYDTVEAKIKHHYGNDNLNEYKSLYRLLKDIQIDNYVCEDFFICIHAYKEIEEDYYKLDDFDEDDISLCFDVSGYTLSENDYYSISSSSYSEFVKYKVDDYTMNLFSFPSILAHCLREITFYGFHDN